MLKLGRNYCQIRRIVIEVAGEKEIQILPEAITPCMAQI
jgi:hypothetical protein